MHAKLKSLVDNWTWSVVDFLHRKVPIGCRRVLKIKYNANGSVERYNVRLVVKGYTQMEGCGLL